MHCSRLFHLGSFALLLALASPLQADLSPAHQRLAATMSQGDPDQTILAADALLNQQPQDVTALRAKAIALMEKEQLPEAIALLRQALKIDPDSVACRYYLAEALGTNGDVAESVRLLDEVKLRAPDSEYARRADVVLPELRPMLAEISPFYDTSLGSNMIESPAGAERRFKAQLRLAMEYDDNVAARASNSPLTGPEASGRVLLGWALDYTPLHQALDSGPFSLGLTLDGYQSWHERQALNDFDVNQNIVGAYLDRQGKLDSMPYRARLSGNWEHTQVGNEFFNHALGFKTLFDLQWKPWAMTSLHYGLDDKDFNDDTATPGTFSRDGAYQTAGVDQYFYLCENRLILGLGYAYRWADTRGSQFETNAHTANASVQVSLPWKLTWRGALSYSSEDFTQYTPDPQRLDNAWMVSTSLSRPIFNENLSVELSYNYFIADSSVAFAEYQRHIVGLGLRYRY